MIRVRKACSGFTLVELLVVIAILGTISGLFIYSYRTARLESSNQKTQTTIQKLSEIINSRMQEYENLAVPFAISSTAVPRPGTPTPPQRVLSREELIERAKLLMAREIIRTEMPDHPDDLKATPYWLDPSRLGPSPVVIRPLDTCLVEPSATPFPPNPNTPMVMVPTTPIRPTGLTSKAARIFGRLATISASSAASGANAWDLENANAELLFLIVEDSEFDGGSAIEMFDQSEIRDTDGDGLSEFIDAFGRPIRWIRWPTGLQQPGRGYPDMLNPSVVHQVSQDLSVDSEPLDRLRTDPGWNEPATSEFKPGLFPPPLIVSAGPDGYFGLNFREVNRYGSGPSPSWPTTTVVAGSLSCSDLRFPSTNVVGLLPASRPFYAFSDPWAPREPAFAGARMGAYLSGTEPPELKDGQPARSTSAAVAEDNVSNLVGGVSSL
jgi:prepilin-type N-terminal cleavage/methylation domain-containing protein